MPWDHCDVEFILDDEPCPRCGVAKGAWTVQVEQTRTLRIGRKKPPPRRLTLAHIARVLARLEEGKAAISAQRFLERLDYDFLTELAQHGVREHDPENHPSLLAPEERAALERHVLLWGMRDPLFARVCPAQRLFARIFPDLSDEAELAAETEARELGQASISAYLRWLDEHGPAPGSPPRSP